MRKVAAIDVGSSATRLSTLAVTATGMVAHAETRRFDMRLGADVFADGTISPGRHKALVALFVDIARSLRRAGITHYRAVATSAMRDAHNGPAVAAAIAAASGLRLEIITGQQEGALSRRALVRALGSVDAQALLVDLGGGSLELERLSSGVGQSVPMGTVRLLALFPQLRGPLPPAALQAAYRAIVSRLHDVAGPAAKAPQAIGTGGNLEALAKVLGHANALVSQFATTALPALAASVGPLSLPERANRYHLRAERADLFLPAVLVLQAIAELYAVDRFVVPRTGLRDAMLVDLLPDDTVADGQAEPLVHLNLALFDLLYPLHALWPPARRLLAATARSHAEALATAAASAASATEGASAAVQMRRRLPLTPAQAAVHDAAMLQLMQRAPGPQSAKRQHVAAILSGIVTLAQAAAAGLAAAEVVALCRGLRLDVLGEPVVLHVGRALPAHAARPLGHALGRALVLR